MHHLRYRRYPRSADLLDPLLGAIEDDASASSAEPRVLFLGDIVDRGPSSREAMDLVCDILARWPQSRLIRGNHDSYFLDFMTVDLVDGERFGKWMMRLGGYQTMESYGLLVTKSIRDAAARLCPAGQRALEPVAWIAG